MMHPEKHRDTCDVDGEEVSVEKRHPEHEGLDTVGEEQNGRLYEREENQEEQERASASGGSGNEVRREVRVVSAVHDAGIIAEDARAQLRQRRDRGYLSGTVDAPASGTAFLTRSSGSSAS